MRKKLLIGFLAVAGCWTAGALEDSREVILNGGFAEIVDVAEKDKAHIQSVQFPKHWNVYGGRLVTENNRNRIELSDYLYTLLRIPQSETPTRLKGEITVSGEGKLKIYLSGCIRKPGDKRGFGNELKPVLGEFVLSEKAAVFPFEYEAEPYSQYYLEFKQTGGKALIEKISFRK
ncbi:MAG: hypothetical protein BWY31_03961 [Lentisphaerae bacterium ADurb.Bin242]|nr:MAG: hypothetical protein BWY31_03961 [Lentisphaerae bacterium ADurb.Bin242]